MTSSSTPPPFRCPYCAAALLQAPKFECRNCQSPIEVVNGVPILLKDKTLLQGRGKAAVAEMVFQQSRGYSFFVSAKRVLARDTPIGTNAYTAGKDVLDVGCGPNLMLGHLEYNPRDCKTLTAVDISLPFVSSARLAFPSANFAFAVASIDQLPFADKSFDTTVVSFVLHHLPFDLRATLAEVARVTRRHIVIYDHLRSETPWKQSVQTTYWRIMDGGDQYLTMPQWKHVLQDVDVRQQIRTGAIFKHVTKFVCEVRS